MDSDKFFNQQFFRSTDPTGHPPDGVNIFNLLRSISCQESTGTNVKANGKNATIHINIWQVKFRDSFTNVPRDNEEIMIDQKFPTLPIFNDFNETQMALLRPLFSLNEFAAGETIFNQGDAAKNICIIIEGEVDICFKPDDAELITVAHLEQDGVFGWSAAFGSGIYTSGAVAVTDLKLICVNGTDLKKLNEDHPKTGILILGRLADIVGKRLKRTNVQGRNQVMAMLEHGLKNGIKPLGG